MKENIFECIIFTIALPFLWVAFVFIVIWGVKELVEFNSTSSEFNSTSSEFNSTEC